MRIIGLFCWWAMVAAIAQAQDTFTLTLLHRDLASAMGNKPVGNSPLVLREQGGNRIYSATTDAQGQAVLVLPVDRDFLLSLDCEHCEAMEPIEVRCAGTQAGVRMTFSFQEYSAAYYRQEYEKAQAQRAMEAAERAREEAEYQRQLAELARQEAYEKQQQEEKARNKALGQGDAKNANVLFYLVLPDDEMLVHKVTVYADDTKKKSYGDTGGYYYKGTACMGSLTNNPEGAAHNHHPKTGTYKYYALSDDGKYEWRGTYTISEGKTTAVALRLSDAVRRKK